MLLRAMVTKEGRKARVCIFAKRLDYTQPWLDNRVFPEANACYRWLREQEFEMLHPTAWVKEVEVS